MRFGYVFYWVDDVPAEAAFYRSAFGIDARVLEEVPGHGWRAELETGATTLYLADVRELGLPGEIPDDAYRVRPGAPAAAFQVTFVDEDVPARFREAVRHGASVVAEPYEVPWGQTLARLRTPAGAVLSLASVLPG